MCLPVGESVLIVCQRSLDFGTSQYMAYNLRKNEVSDLWCSNC